MTEPCPFCEGTYSDRHPCCPEMAEQQREARDEAEDQRCNQERDEREERRYRRANTKM